VAAGCQEPPASPPPLRFVEVSRQAGIEFQHFNGATGEYYYPETYGSGAGFLDYDRDGWLDVYLVNGAALGTATPPVPPPQNRMFRNRGDGTFLDATAQTGTGHTGFGMGCAVGDYDDDGNADLYVANFGPNVMYRNRGDGTFADVTGALGVGDERWASSCGFLDYDLDGDLDLFVVNYAAFRVDENPVCTKGPLRSYCDPSAFPPIGDVLYRNDGDRFTDVTALAGLDLVGRGLGVAFHDYDEDGDTDIYVANDGMANFLYENQGGRFVDRGLPSGTQFSSDGRAQAGMGVDWGDFDADGRADIVVGNFAYETAALYRNLGGGTFVEASGPSGVGAATYMPLTFGAKFADFDNDGYLDILATNGHVLDNIEQIDPAHTYAQASQLLRNLGGRRFADVSAHLGPDFTAPVVARGTAVADYDNDGDLDVLINTVAGRPRLLRNDGGNRQHWLMLALTGRRPRDALGARVTVRAGNAVQRRQRQSGGSYQAAHDPRLHFGLGDATRADVEVVWPDGSRQVLAGVAADQLLPLAQ